MRRMLHDGKVITCRYGVVTMTVQKTTAPPCPVSPENNCSRTFSEEKALIPPKSPFVAIHPDDTLRIVSGVMLFLLQYFDADAIAHKETQQVQAASSSDGLSLIVGGLIDAVHFARNGFAQTEQRAG